MSVKALASFKSKFLKPCKKLLPILRFKLKKPIYIRACRAQTNRGPKNPRKKLADLFQGLFSPRRKKTKGMDKLVKLKSFSERESNVTMLFPSPLTPAYLKRAASLGLDDVEDSCRSFENYLAEMIVEEGKSKDLRDVEELLYCWNSLNCPVFIGLVSRFYGELCKDLFSAQNDEVDNIDHNVK